MDTPIIALRQTFDDIPICRSSNAEVPYAIEARWRVFACVRGEHQACNARISGSLIGHGMIDRNGHTVDDSQNWLLHIVEDNLVVR